MFHEIQKYISRKSSTSFWFSFFVHVCLLVCLLFTSITLPESLDAFKLEMAISSSQELNEDPVTLLSFDNADTGFEITPTDIELAAIAPPTVNLTSFIGMLAKESIRKKNTRGELVLTGSFSTKKNYF